MTLIGRVFVSHWETIQRPGGTPALPGNGQSPEPGGDELPFFDAGVVGAFKGVWAPPLAGGIQAVDGAEVISTVAKGGDA